MGLSFFIKGIVIGLSIAVPVGPIGLLCIKRTLEKGKASGFISGLGAATADLVYGIIAASGLAVITNVLVSYKSVLHLIGGLFLVYLGAMTFFKSSELGNAAKPKLAGDYFSTLGLTLTNPITIFSFMAIFAGLGFVQAGNLMQKILLVLGVFFGSLLWWLVLSQAVGTVKHRLNHKTISLLNMFSGAVIIILGVLALLRLF